MPFGFFGDKKKAVIAMAHIGALPGAPGLRRRRRRREADRGRARRLDKLQDGGVDAVMFGNEFDRPYQLKAPPEGIAAMTAVIQAVKPALRVPFGVNYLWDPLASVAIAAATGAQFVREIFTGVFASDMGVWAPDCASAARLRAQLGRRDIKLMFNINAEFAFSLDQRPIELRARSAVFSSLADAILDFGAADRRIRRPFEPGQGARGAAGDAGVRQYRGHARQCRATSCASPTASSSAPT